MRVVNIFNNQKKILITVVGVAALSWSTVSLSSGFALQEQNAVNLGTAYSGTAAWAVDASSAWYNPAALTHIKNKQVVASGVLVNTSGSFTASSTNVPFQPFTPVPSGPNDNSNPGGLSLIPSLHYAARIHPNLVFGLSLASPYGLATNYSPEGVMRYVATHSEVLTLDLSPSFAYQATPWLSIGAGLDALFAEAIFELQTTAYTAGDPAFDGFQNSRANDWALGWHLGFLIDFNKCTRLGLNYRSKYDLNVKGVSHQLMPITPASVAQSGEFVLRPVHAEVVLPETLVLSGYHAFNPHWAVMADASWTAWGRLPTLGLRFDPLPNDAPPLVGPVDGDTLLNFKDTYKVALGVNYTLNKCWQFRAGTAFDRTPIQDEVFRTARLPDSDRIWLSLGASYTFAQMRVDLGYAHLFMKEATLSDGGPVSPINGLPLLPWNNVTGKYLNHADILGIQLRYDFV